MSGSILEARHSALLLLALTWPSCSAAGLPGPACMYHSGNRAASTQGCIHVGVGGLLLGLAGAALLPGTTGKHTGKERTTLMPQRESPLASEWKHFKGAALLQKESIGSKGAR